MFLLDSFPFRKIKNLSFLRNRIEENKRNQRKIFPILRKYSLYAQKIKNIVHVLTICAKCRKI